MPTTNGSRGSPIQVRRKPGAPKEGEVDFFDQEEEEEEEEEEYTSSPHKTLVRALGAMYISSPPRAGREVHAGAVSAREVIELSD